MSLENLVYVGTYSEPIRFGTGQPLEGQGEGIYRMRLDPERRTLSLEGITRGVRNASYLALDRQRAFLYCVNEFKEYEGKPSGGVTAFRISSDTGELTYLNSKPSHGTDPCHIRVHPSGKFVAIANFASGGVTVLANYAGRLDWRRDRVCTARGLKHRPAPTVRTSCPLCRI